jgi:predicted ATPase/DNA-binding CsgD family transcriptional regulator
VSPLPTALTRFVGRARERSALAALVREHRLVTAVGPGGVGKTRLSVAVADDIQAVHRDGVAFVDLVQVTDPAMVVPAVADALGVPERAGVTRRDGLIGALADRDVVLVLDNCEHVLDGARGCVQDVLGAGPAVRVLATSRIRLLVPGEHVFAVPGLSIEDDEGGDGDAVELFIARLSASGSPMNDPDELATIRDLCRALDGMALAIEIAAARVPSLGLDGLQLALRDSLEPLALRHDGDDRHRSLRATIDWSYHLLDDEEQAVLRGCTVFAAPFTLTAAAAVLDREPAHLVAVLGRLVDGNLVTLRSGLPTRYRALETIRQYAEELARALGELDATRERHLTWCRTVLEDLRDRAPGDAAWCVEVDRVLDEARAAVRWAAEHEGGRADAAALAALTGEVSFLRGRAGEAQQRFAQAAALAEAPAARHDWLFLAARAALTRYVGREAVALLEEAAGVAVAAGDDEQAALDLAHAAAILHRHVGTMTTAPTPEETDGLLRRAAALGRGSAASEAAIAVATIARIDQPHTRDEVLAVIEQARAVGDPLLTDAALDMLCARDLGAGELAAAADTVATRLAALAAVPVDPASAMDHLDAALMGVHVDLAAGRLRTARRHADAIAAMPFLREEPHVALGRRLEVDAVAGTFDGVLEVSQEFLAGWVRAGRPQVNNLGSAAYAVAMVHGMRGEADERAEWVAVTRALVRDPDDVTGTTAVWPAFLDGLLHLHHGDVEAAAARLADAPDRIPDRVRWSQSLWIAWYAAAWAEASGLLAVGDLEQRLQRASEVARGNDVALAVIERTAALARGDGDALPGLVRRFETAGCAYQAERTALLADGRSAGTAVPGPPPPLAQLSSREQEVLRLVAAGQTNAQIAAALFISRKTAEHHVSHILTKLGLTTRAEAAALAGRLGITDR